MILISNPVFHRLLSIFQFATNLIPTRCTPSNALITICDSLWQLIPGSSSSLNRGTAVAVAASAAVVIVSTVLIPIVVDGAVAPTDEMLGYEVSRTLLCYTRRMLLPLVLEWNLSHVKLYIQGSAKQWALGHRARHQPITDFEGN